MEALPSALVLALLLLAACRAPEGTSAFLYEGPARAERPAHAAPPLERAVVVRAARSGERLSFAALLDRLSEADVVFLGESHTDETTHRVELGIYEGLLARRRGEVVLAMEMFERDVQPQLDDYLAGRIDEPSFLAASRPWGNYRSAYRPLIEHARAAGKPVVASNFPRQLRVKLAREGADALSGDPLAPAELFPNTPAYWRRVDNAVRGHLAMMRVQDDDTERLTSTQTLWDNSMGEACALALDRHPGSSVLHVNGGFHSAYWDGTVRQLRLRKPDARVLTVAISVVTNPAIMDVGEVASADYVVFAEARASDPEEGRHRVSVTTELRYRLHVPEGATDEAPVPLLVWLSEDGTTAADGLALWRERLGDEVAIAALEPLHRQDELDGAEGGRWFWPDSFLSDVGTTSAGLERVWGYLLRNFPLDPERVCVAGEGAGAALVTTTALITSRLAARAVALAPRGLAKVRDLPLPLPELRGPDELPMRSLSVLVGEDDAEAWRGELDQYVAVGLDAVLVSAEADPWRREAQRAELLRASLGLAPAHADEAHAGPAAARAYVVLSDASPRAHRWARLLGLRHTAATGEPVAVLDAAPADGAARALDLTIRAADFAGPRALPACPGPFGGSTVVVLPDGVSPAERAAWLDLEAADPLQARSRFLRLRVATGEGDRTLAGVVGRLFEEGRKNLLIVPGTFCADAARMAALRRALREAPSELTLQWLPGLGASLGVSHGG